MAAFSGQLYAGTFNPHTGLQVWKASLDRFPYRWKPVLTAGASRGNTNESVASMCVFRGALYIGTGIQGLSYDPTYDAGPGGAELIRIFPDDSWELVVGEVRRSFTGTTYPLSDLAPGFDNKFSCVIWRLAEHDGWLYAGTYDWSSLLGFLRPFPPDCMRGVISRFVEQQAGFDLWLSRDGATWEPVTLNGFGNPFNNGLRSLFSTQKGLFVGTQAMPLRSGRNPLARNAAARGDCEVWWGSASFGPRMPARRS